MDIDTYPIYYTGGGNKRSFVFLIKGISIINFVEALFT
jgi:hypothetical protein